MMMYSLAGNTLSLCFGNIRAINIFARSHSSEGVKYDRGCPRGAVYQQVAIALKPCKVRQRLLLWPWTTRKSHVLFRLVTSSMILNRCKCFWQCLATCVKFCCSPLQTEWRQAYTICDRNVANWVFSFRRYKAHKHICKKCTPWRWR